MAGALRPVVFLMALASALFFADGILDEAYPGGASWIGGPAHYGLGVLSYVFAIANAALAVLIARGSERTLMARIGLAAFFLIERPLTAFALGPKQPAAVAVHLATALVELVILVGAVRVWRLSRSVGDEQANAMLDLDAPSPVAPEEDDVLHVAIPPRVSWTIGALTLALAATFVADGITAGFIPGGRQWGLAGDATGWLAYLFAVVALTVAVPAVHGGTLALRLLFALSLIFLIERAFSPFALRSFQPVGLALHVAGAFLALGLALAAVNAIRHGAGEHDDQPHGAPQTSGA